MPSLGTGKFLPQIATKLGCNPKKHFKVLVDGQNVTLENGTVITPEQVTEIPEPVVAFCNIFLPDVSYIDSFILEN